MKIVLTIISLMLIIGCSPIKEPRLAFGKKCVIEADQVIWSHVWVYDKTDGLKANIEDCKLIAPK